MCAGRLASLQDKSSAETWIETLMGGSCYTHSLQRLHKNCDSMSMDDMHWLALEMANCFHQGSGRSDLLVICERRTHSLEQCTKDMNPNSFQTYATFFSNIHPICLFVQNQNFKQQTAALLASMHSSSQQASALMDSMSSDLNRQAAALHGLGQQLDAAEAHQRAVAESVAAGTAEMRRLKGHADVLEAKLDKSLVMGVSPTGGRRLPCRMVSLTMHTCSCTANSLLLQNG